MAWVKHSLLCAMLLCCSVATGAEIVSPVQLTERVTAPPHTLIRVKLDAGERVLVIGTNQQSSVVQFIDQADWALRSTTGDVQLAGVVWTAEPGYEYAMVVYGADGDAPKYTIVEILDATPVPPGPGPTPPPPVPPQPITPPNTHGVGLQTYNAAKKVGDPDTAQILARIYKETAGKVTTLDAGDDIADMSAAFKYGFDQTELLLPSAVKPKWQDFRNEMKAMIEGKWKEGRNTKEKIMAILLEMAQALEMVK